MYHIYNLSGLWCTEPNRTTRHGNVKLIQRSNKSLTHLFMNIGLRCWKRQQVKDAYVSRVIRDIRKSLDDPSVVHVYVIGHSYGGYVASEVVLSLRDDPHVHKLIVNTYASIYLLGKMEFRGIQMKQYMNRDDIALRCNDMPKDGITWMNKKKKHNMFDEWTIHLNYPLDSIVDSLIKKLNS